MVSNAGIGEQTTPIEEKAADDWDRSIESEPDERILLRKVRCARSKGRWQSGVINMSSIIGTVDLRGAPAYCAAKHGILGLTKAAALKLAPVRIRIVAVSPAFIHTPLIAGLEDSVLPLHPIGRLGDPEEVVALTAFLPSDEAAFNTGAHCLADGGYTAQ